ncbi:hypothetical protein pb186bvf_008712 [Paramecium bursaria]
MNQYIKSIEQLKLITVNDSVHQIVDNFISFRQKILGYIKNIEQEIIKSVLDMCPSDTINYFQKELTSSDLDAVISNYKLIQTINLQQQKEKIFKLKQVYSGTLKRIQDIIDDKLKQSVALISQQVEYGQDEIISRLSEKDEGIVLEVNGFLFYPGNVYCSVFTIKISNIVLLGIYQPFMFDGLYYEEGFNSQNEPHKIKYKLHQGFDLQKTLYEEEVGILHQEQEKENGYYKIMFKNPVQLDGGNKYTLSATTTDEIPFGTHLWKVKAKDNNLIQFQVQDYGQDSFLVPPGTQEIHSYADRGLFPALIVKEI